MTSNGASISAHPACVCACPCQKMALKKLIKHQNSVMDATKEQEWN